MLRPVYIYGRIGRNERLLGMHSLGRDGWNDEKAVKGIERAKSDAAACGYTGVFASEVRPLANTQPARCS